MNITGKLMAVIASASLGAGMVAPALAQNVDASGARGTAAMGVAASVSKPTKEQRKAARKAARMKKNVELKKLEDAGYQPYRSDTDYPQNLKDAQKKAGIGQGASQ
ncbi:MAG: DUF4148 domain-containing protein [Verrucomicrobia bacterium]|jgi:hypothetical protein|nr:DUF4148 domain-containing protein [Verrucomicrobiota bacterium]